MKITFIEPTPSPNTMKLHLDESLEPGIRRTYTPESQRSAPAWARDMLSIPGVTSIYHAADFAALERKGSADWAAILREVQSRFGSGEGLADDLNLNDEHAGAHFGEAQVFVQMFRGIPIQIRVKTGAKEERIALASRFTKAVTDVASAVMIKERKLTDYGVRYGEPAEITREVEQELEAAYPQERLDSLVQQAIAHGTAGEFVEQRHKRSQEELLRDLKSADWRMRYAALEDLAPTAELLPELAAALHDAKLQIRRLAVVYLGDLRTPEAMELLYEAMADSAPAVRRTAGDTLSDIGDPAATPVMTAALSDSSKLVRWRAARFLYEVGTAEAQDALTLAADDPEFEVGLQARMALERIASGEEAAGTVWQQMSERRRN
ncbi:conserved virulence factor C family protein [Paenibacillus albidus]|uniref:conserved virulence factor C family protein n=1 Tax=Paenibacillus albidus TaxID=2041023 RepID=UPI001BE798AE|nr:virulence factor [Paenibacillus albidus]MBT2291037.1 conserved virulence factor C family protein [Paenibacillus albidus]